MRILHTLFSSGRIQRRRKALYLWRPRELAAFFPKLKPGGYIAGDDHDRRGIWDHGVTRAVDECRASGAAATIRLHNHQFLLRKPL
jgi:hypothetical protein